MLTNRGLLAAGLKNSFDAARLVTINTNNTIKYANNENRLVVYTQPIRKFETSWTGGGGGGSYVSGSCSGPQSFL